MKTAILVCVLATAASATFVHSVMGSGFGQSTDPAEAAGKAASDALSELYGKCNGRISDVANRVECRDIGGGYTGCTAFASATCTE